MKELEVHKIAGEGQFMYWLKDGQGIAGEIVATESHSDTNKKILRVGRLIVRQDLRGLKIASDLHSKLVSWARNEGYGRIIIELAPQNKQDLEKMSAIIEHFGYKCDNPQHMGMGILLGYHLDLG